MTNIETTLKRIERKIDKQAEPKWVRAEIITELTGWTPSRMRTARINNDLEWKQGPSGKYLYNINSLHPYLIKK